MEITAHMSLLQQQGFNPSNALSQPSFVAKDIFGRLGSMSASFDNAIAHTGNFGRGTAPQSMDWTRVGNPSGRQDSLPGPARSSPVQSRNDVGSATGYGASEQELIQAALTMHGSMMQATTVAATVEATSSGSKRSLQNVDTLIRGQ